MTREQIRQLDPRACLCVVVDMQEDFVNGCLGTDEAKKIVGPMTEFLKDFPGRKIFTRDTHYREGQLGIPYADTQEGRRLPVPHCIYMTEGWNVVPEISAALKPEDCYLDKKTFGSMKFGNDLHEESFEHIFFVGVCTGICVISNAVIAKASDPEAEIHVIENLCACVTPESHRNAIEAMKLLQCSIETWEA